MNTLTQLDLLLNQLYNCSDEISNYIENDQLEELLASIKVKEKLLEKIEQVKQTSSTWDLSKYGDLIAKIDSIELANIKKLSLMKADVHSEFQLKTRTSKLLNTYEPQKETSGKILDMSE